MSAKDMWAGDTGQLDNFEMTVNDAKFGFTDYNKGKTPLLILEGPATTVDDGKVQDHHLWYSIGETMEPSPDGSSCKHESGDANKSFNSRAAVMDLIRAAFKCGEEAEAHLRKFSPLDAKAWVGTRWLFQIEVTGRFTPEGETEERVVSRALPKKFLGVGGVEATGAGASTPQATNTQAAPSTAPSNGGGAAMLTVLAKQTKSGGGDYWKFLEAAVEKGYDPNSAELSEESGVWATA